MLFRDFAGDFMDVYVTAKLSEQRTKRRILDNHLLPFFGKKLFPRSVWLARAEAHVRESPGDARRAAQGRAGAAGARDDRHDDALRAPMPGRETVRDRAP